MNTLRGLIAQTAFFLAPALLVLATWPAVTFAQNVNTSVYIEQGGNKLVVASGGEIEIRSGATLDVQSGATTDYSGGVDLDGASLVVDADGDTALVEVSDDVTSYTLGAAAGYLNILTGSLKVGNGSPSTSLNGEDAYVEGTFEVDGTCDLDGALTVAGTSTLSGTLGVTGASTLSSTLAVTGASTLSSTLAVAGAQTNANDITVSADATGGNAGAINQFIGVPRITMVALGTMTNGTTLTVSLMDDTPAADWSAVGGTADPTDTEDTTYYRVGSKSLKLAWLDAAVDGDGVTDSISSADFEANESVGFWFYADATIASGDFEFVFTDDGGARTFNIPAYSVADKWQWMEIDISSLNGGTGDAITAISILISAQGASAVGDINMYFDGLYCWDAADEEALGQNIQTDGVLGVVVMDFTSGGAASTTLALYTDYFVHYEAGNDFIVTLTDQSNTDKHGLALIAY